MTLNLSYRIRNSYAFDFLIAECVRTDRSYLVVVVAVRNYNIFFITCVFRSRNLLAVYNVITKAVITKAILSYFNGITGFVLI